METWVRKFLNFGDSHLSKGDKKSCLERFLWKLNATTHRKYLAWQGLIQSKHWMTIRNIIFIGSVVVVITVRINIILWSQTLKGNFHTNAQQYCLISFWKEIGLLYLIAFRTYTVNLFCFSFYNVHRIRNTFWMKNSNDNQHVLSEPNIRLRAFQALSHNLLMIQVLVLSPHDKFTKRVPLYFFYLTAQTKVCCLASRSENPFILLCWWYARGTWMTPRRGCRAVTVEVNERVLQDRNQVLKHEWRASRAKSE